jgi:hypothetical protein
MLFTEVFQASSSTARLSGSGLNACPGSLNHFFSLCRQYISQLPETEGCGGVSAALFDEWLHAVTVYFECL